MTGRRASLFAFLAGAIVASGCGFVPRMCCEREGLLPLSLVGRQPGFLLLGAGEDDAFEEMDTESEEGVPPQARGVELTVRAGVFVIGAAEDIVFNPSFTAGAGVAFPVGEKMGMELAADYSGVSDAGGDRSSTLILLSAGATVSMGGGLYLLGSGVLVLESYADDLTDFSGANKTPLLGLGAGFRPTEGKWDARVGYSMPLGVESPGIFAVSGGYAF